MGVLLAVILDDERSRENFHQIDHNYFGERPPLASNSGEIMRVGVSQHCEFNSNTQIIDNYFEHCDGETEIVSIKSCSNVVRGNLFKECQGGVVLRHGNYNTVENNIFLGNGKDGTGGVRIINKGQWVVNNFFYKCRGVDFRSPLSVMNGIPNSPANRYVQVTDAVIANNSFYDCSSISFCEGSDAERTLPPANVVLVNNIFYNNKDSIIYRSFDNTDGFAFAGNITSPAVRQSLPAGFIKGPISTQKNDNVPLPVAARRPVIIPDSLQKKAQERLNHPLRAIPGFSDLLLLKNIEANAFNACGASWFKSMINPVISKPVLVSCGTVDEIYAQLKRPEPVIIKLTRTKYQLTQPFTITKYVQFTAADKKVAINFETPEQIAVFVIAGQGNLSLLNLAIEGKNVRATHLIASDSNGSSAHYNAKVENCRIINLGSSPTCKNIFYAYKYMTADSVVFRNNIFALNHTNGIMMTEEKDDKGYYNAEKIIINNNSFTKQSGILLSVYRGGNDESTMGPRLSFIHNSIVSCDAGTFPLISFTGVQVTNIFDNIYADSNLSGILVSYKDTVRARHQFEKNKLILSGRLDKNQFVTETNNIIK
jgi:poly(beta-D-mannuronate) lyase